jgi:hypothetical protein
MFGYQSKEMKKFTSNAKELELSQLQNKEIIGLFMIGEISYKEMNQVLDLSEQEARDLIEGLSFQLSRNVLRDDRELQVDVWEPSEENEKEIKEYTIESKVSFTHEKEKELVELMKEHGEIAGTAGGFPVGPMVYKWKGTSEALSLIKELGARVL